MSRNPSPKRLSPRTVTRTNIPGNTVIHQDSLITAMPSFSMFPQLGVGGGVPAPKKLKEASTMMEWAKIKVI
jgi:hypothetical protein